MTRIGSGGVVIKRIELTERFKRDYKKLTPEFRELVENKLKDLKANPRPSGLAFEKLKGYKKPNIYTIHMTGNYKISMEISGDTATLRRVSNHDTIDRNP